MFGLFGGGGAGEGSIYSNTMVRKDTSGRVLFQLNKTQRNVLVDSGGVRAAWRHAGPGVQGACGIDGGWEGRVEGVERDGGMER